jgi:hypothetical protein
MNSTLKVLRLMTHINIGATLALLAGVTAALWIVWAVGYTQGAAKAPKPSATSTTTSAPVNVACCLRHIDT